MAIFGFGQQDPYAEQAQLAQDRATAFEGIKDNLPALGLIAGLSMLAHNNGSRSVGQLVGRAGADALNAYGTWQKLEEARQRQKLLDEERKEQREYDRGQDAWRNDMAERRFGLEQAKMAQDMALARARLGMEGARLAMARQAAGMAAAERAAQEEYAKTHYVDANGIPWTVRKDEKGQPLLDENGRMVWVHDEANIKRDKDGNIIGVKAQEDAKFADINAAGKRFLSDSAPYMTRGEHLSNLFVGAQQNSAAGDLAMIFSYMKMLDPTSVVREGEQASAQNAAGVPDRIRNLYNNLLTGQRLTQQQRREFLTMGRDMFAKEARMQAPRKEMFTDYAKRYNMDPRYVVQDPYSGLLGEVDDWIKKSLEASGASAGAGTGAGAGIPGVTGRGGPAGRADPGAAALPPGFRVVR